MLEKEDFLPEALLIAFFPVIVVLAFTNVLCVDTATLETLINISATVSLTGLTAHIFLWIKRTLWRSILSIRD